MGTLLLRNVVRDGVSCDIYIKEGVVSSIGHGLAMDADTVLDGGGKTVMPAFVNMHTHSGMTLFRGICEDMPLSRWLDAVWKAETVLDDEFIYWATRLACLEMIKTGTAAFNDMYWRVDKAARAVEDSGMRAFRGRSARPCMRLHGPGLPGCVSGSPSMLTILSVTRICCGRRILREAARYCCIRIYRRPVGRTRPIWPVTVCRRPAVWRIWDCSAGM